MVDSHTAGRSGRRAPAWRRWLGIVLRSLHLAGVTLLGAAVLGAPVDLRWGALPMLASGLALLAVERADGRIRLAELAGVVVLAKLALTAWMVADARLAPWLFWIVLIASALSSHAPRDLRHWKPGPKR